MIRVLYWKVTIIATIKPAIVITADVDPCVSTTSANFNITKQVFVQFFVIIKIIHNNIEKRCLSCQICKINTTFCSLVDFYSSVFEKDNGITSGSLYTLYSSGVPRITSKSLSQNSVIT